MLSTLDQSERRLSDVADAKGTSVQGTGGNTTGTTGGSSNCFSRPPNPSGSSCCDSKATWLASHYRAIECTRGSKASCRHSSATRTSIWRWQGPTTSTRRSKASTTNCSHHKARQNLQLQPPAPVHLRPKISDHHKHESTHCRKSQSRPRGHPSMVLRVRLRHLCRFSCHRFSERCQRALSSKVRLQTMDC